ncbi:MAG TPA: cytidine deaminase [Firmicutes bacterium]|nr:cytidine deaminase [Bacillota bacterium]
MKETYQDLIQAAKTGYENAYAPYSKFNVGAAVLTKDGKVFIGSNIENASYGLTNCAERSALFAAYSQKYRRQDFKAIAIVANCDRPISPCGACRQVMSELLPADCDVILTNLQDDIKTITLEELLPYSFTSEDL